MAPEEYLVMSFDCILAFVDIMLLIELICNYLWDKLDSQRVIRRVEVEHRLYKLMAEDFMSSVKIIAQAQGIYDYKEQGDGEEVAPNTGCTKFERGPQGTSTTSRVDNSDGTARGKADRPGEGAAQIDVEGTHEGAARVNIDGRAKVNVESGHEDNAEVNLEGVDEDTIKGQSLGHEFRLVQIDSDEEAWNQLDFLHAT